MMANDRSRLKIAACYLVGAVLLGGALLYVLFGNNKGLGIFFVLVAAILCRVLVINLAGPMEAANDERRREQNASNHE
jgi:hypothetical protein